jgi:hypothetical protein
MRGYNYLIHFISNIEVQSDPTTKQLYQSDPKCIFLFRNPNESDRICTPLIIIAIIVYTLSIIHIYFPNQFDMINIIIYK